MRSVFARNDYNFLYARYFDDLATSGTVVADPSGWARPETEASIDLSPEKASNALSDYLIDNRKLIAPQKNVLLTLLGQWDLCQYEFSEVTITPSISAASLAVLLLLRNRGIKTVFFETPAYYATIDQATSISLQAVKIPSYHEQSYDWDLTILDQRRRNAIAVWLTQPRFALGQNQSLQRASSILSFLKSRDFLVIDETADQMWPTVLSTLRAGAQNPRLIKIRGFMKPLGLNALRMAFVIHGAQWRPLLQEFQWTVGAALDHYSLAAAVQIATAPLLFSSMLSASRARITSLRRRLGTLTVGSLISLSEMENGYLGSAFLDWNDLPGTYATKRRMLLEACRSMKMPVTLSSAMLFAHDTHRERVRINYFMPANDLEYCVNNLTKLTRMKMII
jgi:histidinol-phosphate/aromatic aminotransferase/cobyric acid decarboxylase-like protein